MVIWFITWYEVIESCDKTCDHDHMLQKALKGAKRNDVKNL